MTPGDLLRYCGLTTLCLTMIFLALLLTQDTYSNHDPAEATPEAALSEQLAFLQGMEFELRRLVCQLPRPLFSTNDAINMQAWTRYVERGWREHPTTCAALRVLYDEVLAQAEAQTPL